MLTVSLKTGEAKPQPPPLPLTDDNMSKHEIVRHTPFGTFLVQVLDTKEEADRMKAKLEDGSYKRQGYQVRAHRCENWQFNQCQCPAAQEDAGNGPAN